MAVFNSVKFLKAPAGTAVRAFASNAVNFGKCWESSPDSTDNVVNCLR